MTTIEGTNEIYYKYNRNRASSGRKDIVSHDFDTQLVYRNSIERFLRRTGIVYCTLVKFIFLDEEKIRKKKLKQNKENVMAELGKKIACESENAAILSVLQRSGASVLDVVHFVRIRIDHFCVHRRLDKKNQMCHRFISIQDFEFLSISRLIVAFVQNLLIRHSSWLLFAGFIRWSVSMMNFFFFATMMIYLSFFFFLFPVFTLCQSDASILTNNSVCFERLSRDLYGHSGRQETVLQNSFFEIRRLHCSSRLVR